MSVPIEVKKGDKIFIKINENSKVRCYAVFYDIDNKILPITESDALWSATGTNETISSIDGFLEIVFRYSDNSDVANIQADIDTDVSAYVIHKENKDNNTLIKELHNGRISGNSYSVNYEENIQCFYTNFIPVQEGDILNLNCYLAGLVGSNNSFGLCGFLDKDIDSFSKWLFNIEIANKTTNNWYEFYDVNIVVPSGVNYVTLTTRANNVEGVLSNPTNWLTKIENVQKSPFYGLKGVAFGCSLTARGRDSDPEYPAGQYFGYLRELQKLSGIDFDNKGVGGYCIYNPTGSSIYNVVTTYNEYADKDIAIIEGDFNGWNTSKPLGTYKDIGTQTTCGCLYNSVKHIKEQNKNITVFVLLDHYGKKYNDTWNGSCSEVRNGLTQYEYYSELKKLCDYHGFVCLPMYEFTNINEQNPQYLEDFIHLNVLGEKQCGSAIYEIMKNYIRQLIN